jgi:peptidoglycan/xylan/chitin deacetylase (PgdA/CDA1 family)
VTEIFQRLRSKGQRLAAKHLAQRPFILKNDRPLISFSFDDFPVSALEVAGPMLERHGIAATYYVSVGLAGSLAPTGRIVEKTAIAQVIERGHELGCHTFGHCHATETEPDEFERNIVKNHRVLREMLPEVTVHTLSYPIGCPRPATKRRCARYFGGCRAGGQTYNAGRVDLDNLQAFFLEQSRDDLDAVVKLIDATCRANGWLILATHDVCPEPTRYGVSPEFFEKIVGHAIACGAVVTCVSRGLSLCGVSLQGKGTSF